MNKVDCDVINDLMPSYIDEICSKSSKVLVEEHLLGCGSCKNLFHQMKTTEIVSNKTDVREIDYMKQVKSHYLNNMWRLSLLMALIIIGMIIVIGNKVMIPTKLYYAILPVLMICGYFVLLGNKPKKQGKLQKIGIVIGILVMAYSVILQMISMSWIANGQYPFGLKIYELGPFIHRQLILVASYHIVVFMATVFKYSKAEQSYGILLSVSATGASLALAFTSIMKNLTSVEHYISIRNNTLFLLVIEGIVVTGLIYLLDRKILIKSRKNS